MATFGINLLNGEPFLLSVNLTGGTSSSGGTTENITAMYTIGGIDAGDVIPVGTTLNKFVKDLLVSIFNPTYTLPTFSLTSNLSANVESGLISDITLTYNFNRGSINGKMVGALWQPLAFQDYRAGTAIKYIIEALDMLLVNNRTIIGQSFIDGANTYSGSVQFGIGPQPLNSGGGAYGTQYPANTVVSSTTIYGRRKAFYGYSNSGTTSAYIRVLSNSLLNPINGSSFTINIPVGATNVVFAYPATLQNITTVKYVEGFNAEVKDNFIQTIVSVEGLNGYSPINYKVYIYTPVEPFPAIATYNCTI